MRYVVECTPINISQLLISSAHSRSAYPIIAYTPPTAGNLPIKTLQWPNIYYYMTSEKIKGTVWPCAKTAVWQLWSTYNRPAVSMDSSLRTHSSLIHSPLSQLFSVAQEKAGGYGLTPSAKRHEHNITKFNNGNAVDW